MVIQKYEFLKVHFQKRSSKHFRISIKVISKKRFRNEKLWGVETAWVENIKPMWRHLFDEIEAHVSRYKKNRQERYRRSERADPNTSILRSGENLQVLVIPASAVRAIFHQQLLLLTRARKHLIRQASDIVTGHSSTGTVELPGIK